MKTGTKSILYGVHHWWKHPMKVAQAWALLYGKPRDPRLWILFFVHDLGYVFCENMDDEEGEKHVELGARIMSIFGAKWRDMALYHSRFYAQKAGKEPSPLCYADKLSFCIEDKDDYIKRAKKSGEIWEYLARFYDPEGKYAKETKLFNAYHNREMTTDEKIDRWFYTTARNMATYSIKNAVMLVNKARSEHIQMNYVDYTDGRGRPRGPYFNSPIIMGAREKSMHPCLVQERYISKNNDNFNYNCAIFHWEYRGSEWNNWGRNLYNLYQDTFR